MRKKGRCEHHNKRKPVLLAIAFGVLLLGLSGCSQSKSENVKNESGEENTIQEDTETAVENEGMQEEPDEDMVPAAIDFEKLNLLDKTEENGISYYNFHTTKETPLPLNEWAKLDVITEKGAEVPAYFRFTSVTRDQETIAEHMDQYMKANDIQTAFRPQPVKDTDEYVLMKYEVLAGNDAVLEEDHIALPSVRFPLQMYSTMSSGDFGDGTAQERELAVTDVSVNGPDSSMLEPGTAMEKAVLCEVPKGYTAYGMLVPYVAAGGRTQSLYFKLEY